MTHKGKQEVTVATKARRSLPAVPAKVSHPLEEFDRLFERIMGRDWMRPFSWGRFPWDEFMGPLDVRVPGVDVIDRDDHISVRAEVPGVDKKDLEVSIADNMLTIKGSVGREEKEETGDYYRREISRGAFSRRIALPANVDASKINAKLQDGILEITLPKAEGATRRSIKVA